MARIISVVDDDLSSAAISATLSGEGHIVGVIRNGALALDTIRLRLPDLVILDCALPGMPGLEVLRRLRGDSTTYLMPVIMLTGPAPAARKCLGRAGLDQEDIDLWEINEAFASVPLRYMRELGIDHEMTNVNGGAIAMGHPLGATGGCLVSTVLDELERRGLHRAMISLCVGGGMGISTIIERC